MNAMQKKRYPGVRPFETADQDLFFGRDRDVQELSVLIALEKLVVLFGKSGFGKSSLINAGLIPGLTKTTDIDEIQLVPIVVRLGSYVEGASLSPLDNLLARLGERASDTEASAFLQSLFQEMTLWYHFKIKSGHTTRFLLIFDQFEEFFTYPLLEQEIFKMQLAELLFAGLPQSVRKIAPSLNKDQRRFLSRPLEVKVLFAIRADRLSQLDSMKDHIPAILHKCFELKGLSEGQAREAIEEPARKQGDFDSPGFAYSPEALLLMLQKLSENKHQTPTLGIEAFQLQILCEYLESEVAAGHIPQNLIESTHFVDKIENIYEGYYQRLLDKLPQKTARAAQCLIEESLIFSDDKTGDSRRLSIDSDVLVQQYKSHGVTLSTLTELENAFILRREVNSLGAYNYEIIHDTLIPAILSAQKKNMKYNLMKNKKIRIFAHASFWVTLFSIMLFLGSNNHNDIEQTIMFETIALMIYITLVYINILWLFPRFLEKKNYIVYFLYSIVICLLFSVIEILILYMISTYIGDAALAASVVGSQNSFFIGNFFVIMFSTLLKIIRWYMTMTNKGVENMIFKTRKAKI